MLTSKYIALMPKLPDIPGERYEYEMNVLLQFAREKIPMVEHEIETVYPDNNASSHFDVLFFILSWFVQRFLVFRRKTRGGSQCKNICGVSFTVCS